MIKPSIVCLKPLAKTILCQSTWVQMLSNTCLMLLASNYNQRSVTILSTGVKISLSTQETEASSTALCWKGYGRDLVPRGEIQKAHPQQPSGAKFLGSLGVLRATHKTSPLIPSFSPLRLCSGPSG